MGGFPDMTAVSPIALAKYKEAHMWVSKIIALIISGEDNKRLQQLIVKLDVLSRWNFGDSYGRISEDEKKSNEKLKQLAGGWTPMKL